MTDGNSNEDILQNLLTTPMVKKIESRSAFEWYVIDSLLPLQMSVFDIQTLTVCETSCGLPHASSVSLYVCVIDDYRPHIGRISPYRASLQRYIQLLVGRRSV